MAEARGMGRGLAAILSAAPKDGAEELRTIPIELIGPSPHQPRKRFDEEALAALASSLEARGVLQPVLVRPLAGGRYELIAGERRWRAAGLAGLEQIPAIVRHDDDAASLELAVIENMAREDLNPVEEARACAALADELGLTREEIGKRIGRSRVAVSNLVRLLDLPDDALDLLERGELSEGHGRALLLAHDHDARRGLARAAATAGWTVRELERRARSAGEPTPRRARAPVHPDQEAAAAQIADAFSGALGTDVRVAPHGDGYRLQLAFETVDEALELARRLGIRAVV
ncbi:MAG TPA: ParB/RepB/Spo0J family partition protein [Conexibacter sp.]|nr:ParB/RepB/Spo0J family partition protein [Conexibacter sp.]